MRWQSLWRKGMPGFLHLGLTSRMPGEQSVYLRCSAGRIGPPPGRLALALFAMREMSRGFCAGIAAAVGYGLLPLFVLPLIAKGMTVDTILFYRFFLGGIGLGVLMLIRREPFNVDRRQLGILALLSLFYAMAAQSVFLGYLFLPSGVVTTIHFLYPVIVAFLMAVFFKEKKSVLTFFAVLLAVGGVGLLSLGGQGGDASLLGIAIVLWSAVSLALFIVGMDWVGRRGMHGLRITFYVLLLGSLPSLGFACVTGHFSFFPDGEAAAIVLVLVLVTAVFSIIVLQMSIELIGSTMTSIVGAMEPVTAVVVGLLVFGELLTLELLSGIALILAAVVLVMLAPQIEGLFIRLRRL